MPPYFPSPATIHLSILMCEVRPQEFNHLSGPTQPRKWNILLPHGALTFSHQP